MSKKPELVDIDKLLDRRDHPEPDPFDIADAKVGLTHSKRQRRRGLRKVDIMARQRAERLAKRKCAITRKEFAASAKDLKCTIEGIPFTCHVKPEGTSSGSLGFGCVPKVTLIIGGKKVECQINLNVTVVYSKELPDESG